MAWDHSNWRRPGHFPDVDGSLYRRINNISVPKYEQEVMLRKKLYDMCSPEMRELCGDDAHLCTHYTTGYLAAKAVKNGADEEYVLALVTITS